jgi:hypothetical protein
VSGLSRTLVDNRPHHRHIAWGGHGLPKVSPGPAIPDPFAPCGRATPKTALRLFRGCPTYRVGVLQPSFTLLDIPRHTPMVGIVSVKLQTDLAALPQLLSLF